MSETLLKNRADLAIYLSECLRDVDNIRIEWRVLKAYIDNFFEDKDE